MYPEALDEELRRINGEILTLRDMVELRLREMNEEIKMLHARVKRLEDAAAKIRK
jgi:tartrate dehydratase beta subunit/fumarate hydratase class I family protein